MEKLSDSVPCAWGPRAPWTRALDYNVLVRIKSLKTKAPSKEYKNWSQVGKPDSDRKCHGVKKGPKLRQEDLGAILQAGFQEAQLCGSFLANV